MTLLSTLLSALSMLLMIAETKADCLANQTLTALGYQNLEVKSYPNSTATICKNLFNQYGACATVDSVKNLINKVNDNLKQRIDDGESFGNVFDSLKGKVKNWFGTTNTTADDADIKAIRDRALSNRNNCLQALGQLNHGAFCYLASQAASTFATDLVGSVEIKVNLTEAGLSLESCLPLIDAVCTTSYGNPISTTAVYNISNSNPVNITNATCNSLKSTYNCTAMDTNCFITRRSILINQLFITNEIPFIPNKSTLDKIKDFFNKIFGRRLQTISKSVTFNAQLGVSENIVTDGKQSNISIPTVSSAALLLTSLIGLFLALFA